MNSETSFLKGAVIVCVLAGIGACGYFYYQTNAKIQRKQEQIKQNIENYQKSHPVQFNIFENYPFLNPPHTAGVMEAQKHLASYFRTLAKENPEKLDKLLSDLQSEQPFLRYFAFAQVLDSLPDWESQKSFIRAHDESFFRLRPSEFRYAPVCLFADQTRFFDAFEERATAIKNSCALVFLSTESHQQGIDSYHIEMLPVLYPKITLELFDLRNRMQQAYKSGDQTFVESLFTKLERQILNNGDLRDTLYLMTRLSQKDNKHYSELKKHMQGIPSESKLSDNIRYVRDFVISKYPQYGKNKEQLVEYFNKGLNQPLSGKPDYPNHFMFTFLEWGIEQYANQSENYPIMLPMWDKGFLHINKNSNKVLAIASHQDESALIQHDFSIDKIHSVQEKFLGMQHLKVIPTRSFARTLNTLLPENTKLNLKRMLDEAHQQSVVFDADNSDLEQKKSWFWWEFLKNLPIHTLFEIMQQQEYAGKQKVRITIEDTGSLDGNIQAWQNEYYKHFHQMEQEKIKHKDSLKGLLEFE